MSNKTIQCDLVLKGSDFIMTNHHVHDVSIMPGVTFLDIIFRILIAQNIDHKNAALRNIVFTEPIATTDQFDQNIRVTIGEPIRGVRQVRTESQWLKGEKAISPWRENMKAELIFSESAKIAEIDLPTLKAGATKIRDNEEVYRIARSEKIVHGPAMKCSGKIYQGEDYLLAELKLNQQGKAFEDQFHLHPATLDSSTLLAYALTEFDPGTPFIPIFIKEFRAPRAGIGNCYIYVPEKEVLAASGDLIHNSYWICDEKGEVIAEFNRLTCKQIRHAGLIQKLTEELAEIEMGKKTTEVISEPLSHSTNLSEFLRSMVAGILKTEPEQVKTNKGFYDLGLDSTAMLSMSESLEKFIGQPLYPTLLFEFSDIDTLSAHLESEYGPFALPTEIEPEEMTTAGSAVKVLKGMVAELLNKEQTTIQTDKGFYDLGLDSTAMLAMSEKLEKFVGQPLYPTLLFEFSDIDTLASYLESNYGPFSNRESDDHNVTNSASMENLAAIEKKKHESDSITEQPQEGYYQRTWEAATTEVQSDLPETTVVIGANSRLTHSLRTHSIQKVIFAQEPDQMDFPVQSRHFLLSIDENDSVEKSFFKALNLSSALLKLSVKGTVKLCLAYSSELAKKLPGIRALSAFCRTIMAETSKIVCQTFEYDERLSELDLATAVTTELADPSKECAVRLQDEQREVMRYKPVTPLASFSFRNEGHYLVFGGMGAIGRILVDELVQQYKARVIVTGRSPETAETGDTIRHWKEQGGDVRYIQADVSNREQVEFAVSEARRLFGPINGVFHCAGVVQDGLYFLKEPQEVAAVIKPKTDGVQWIDQATRGEELDFMALFSSISASIGNPGQSDYAFANAFMEEFALWRNQQNDRKGKTIAIGWPYWADGGMKLSEKVIEKGKRNTGLLPMPSAVGMDVMKKALASDMGNLTFAYGQPDRFEAVLKVVTNSQNKNNREKNNRNNLPETEIAIVGLAGQYPKAKEINQFWKNLKEGVDAVTEVPESRWNHREIFDDRRGTFGKTYSRWGGFLDQIEYFDPQFFGISRKETESMDPQERLFLKSCWHTLEDAGYFPKALNGKAVGVFVGVMWNQYQLVQSDLESATPTAFHASIANRVSHCLNFKGPSLAVDTLCSSSLTAIHLAVESIRRGECDLALAGGVNLAVHPQKYVQLADNQFLSDDGRCRSFGEGGSGYVPGEGVGAVLLKPLREAMKAGDQIYGTISASWLNHNGKTSAFTVPDPAAQADLIGQTLNRFDIDANSIGYIEAHGTGTSLGDPIEIEGLRKAFDKANVPPRSCPVGSVKSNIGHLESAAGIASLTKVLLQMKHQQLVPSLHAETLNRHIDFNRSPVYPQRELAPWKTTQKGGKRRAGISAFGAGGSNVHLVVEEFSQPTVTTENSRPLLFVLSAMDDSVLRDYANSWLKWLNQDSNSQPETDLEVLSQIAALLGVPKESIDPQSSLGDLGVDTTNLFQLAQTLKIKDEHGKNENLTLVTRPDQLIGKSSEKNTIGKGLNLNDLIYTSQVGREQMSKRLAIVVESFRELYQGLEAFLKNEEKPQGCYWGDTETKQETNKKTALRWFREGELRLLAQAWQTGTTLPFDQFYEKQDNHQRISLPCYPFAEQPYWLGRWKSDQKTPAAKKAPGIAQQAIANIVRESLSASLYTESNELDPELSFNDMGLTSVDGVALIETVNRQFGVDIEGVSIYEHPTINQLVAHVQSVVAEKDIDFTMPDDHQSITAEQNNNVMIPEERAMQGIAVIGMAGRFPDAPNLKQYWENLVNGHCSAREVDEQRWNPVDFYDPEGKEPGKIKSRWAALLDRVDSFDAEFFSISPLMAELMDPQQRLFLEEAYTALDDAGYTMTTAEKKPYGVFVGCAVGDYIEWLEAAGKANTGEAFIGVVPSILAARISYALNLSGPALAVDTACSSSLVAVHLACESIRSGECKIAVAGGVALMLTPQLQVRSAQMGILSESGRCAPFDKNANGTVLGEGVGVITLKDLNQAIEDKDHIYGVIQGSGMNSDGKTNGITAPSADSQEALIRKVLDKAGIEAKELSYIEAHGTGTPLGDPIEVNALKQVLRQDGAMKQQCGLGSVKSNIGHTTMAAGIAGLLKVLLAIQHRELPPSLHFENLNPKIELQESPLYVVEQKKEWKPNEFGRRVGAVSSFGFSGTNCHVIVSDFPIEAIRTTGKLETEVETPFYLIPLSGRNKAALIRRIEGLTEFLNKQREPANIEDIALTLGSGRAHFPTRTVLIATDTKDLIKKLQKLSADQLNGDPLASLGNENLPEPWQQLANDYIEGKEIDWNKVPGLSIARRIPLPTYPFAKKRHWLGNTIITKDSETERTEQKRNTVKKVMSNNAHLLLGQLGEQNQSQRTYVAALKTTDWVIADHVVNGEPVLPGVAVLEMAIAAAQRESLFPAGGFQLTKVRWLKPFFAKQTEQLQLRLTTEGERVRFELLDSDSDQIPFATGFIRKTERESDLNIINLAEINARCPQQIDRETLYQSYESSGIQYGSGFRVLESISFSENEAMGQLSLPEKRETSIGNDYQLHPGVMDGAFQTVAVLLEQEGAATLPFALENLEWFRPMRTERYFSHVRKTGKTHYSIDVIDAEGLLCARCTALTLRPMRDPLEKLIYIPKWRDSRQSRTASSGAEKIAILSTFEAQPLAKELATLHGNDEVVTGGIDMPMTGSSFDTIYLLVGEQENGEAPENDSTMLTAFRLVKELLQENMHRKSLTLKLVVHNVLPALSTDSIQPYGAGLIGFSQAVASEYPRWSVACIDAGPLDQNRLDTIARNIYEERAEQGLVAYRGERRMGRYFEEKRLLRGAMKSVFVQGGIYLIVGGSGGLGFEVSRYLAHQVSARLVWVGRRAMDDSLRSQIEKIEQLGGSVLYLQADVANQSEMVKALQQVRTELGSIRGVIHAGGIFRDSSIANMDEKKFQSVLTPKVTGVAVLHRLLKSEPMDFMLLFSSAASFVESSGQANYAAASTFEDSLALYLGNKSNFPVSVVNWGYWGSVGAVSGDSYRKQMASIGLGSIEAPEAMEAIERLLINGISQTLVIKAEPKRLTEWFGVNSGTTTVDPALTRSRAGYVLLDQLSQSLLAEQLASIDAIPQPGVEWKLTELKKRKNVTSGYNRLFDALIDMVARGGWISWNEDRILGIKTPTPSRELRQKLLSEHNDLSPHVELLETCVRAIPEIVDGRRNAMEILFPKGSVSLVQKIYKGQPIANFYNNFVAREVAEEAKAISKKWGRPARILEIGAGTGGTSSVVLPALNDINVEYCYTDVSTAFLHHGKEHYYPAHPFMTFELLDINRPLEQQGFREGDYDIVLATMVLHVAPDMRRGMKNVAALLRPGGKVLINEVTRLFDFLTLTFGLTSDWWAFEDLSQRLPHSPMLSPVQWRDTLNDSGFETVQIKGIADTIPEELEQCLIVGERSSNVVENSLGREQRQAEPQPKSETENRAITTESGQLSETRGYLKRLFADVLKFHEEELGEHTTFENFGVDSLVGQKVVARLEEDWGDLPATLLFEYMTLEELAQYLTENRPEQWRKLLGTSMNAEPATTETKTATVEATATTTKNSQSDVLHYLRGVFAETLKFNEDELSDQATFESFGVDSLVGQKIVGRLEDDLGDLPATLLFEFMTLEELSQYLNDSKKVELGQTLGTTIQPPKAVETEWSETNNSVEQTGNFMKTTAKAETETNTNHTVENKMMETRNFNTDIAVVGVSGRYPKSPDLDSFWKNLSEGVDCVGDIPDERWDWKRYIEAGQIPGAAGFLDQVDLFDPLLFGILPRDAVNMDPQERLFLETCWNLLESTGYMGEYTRVEKTGVFVGSMYGAYGQLAATGWSNGKLSGAHSAHWSLANRVSYCFDLSGPSFAVDSACSSSLTAIHLACESLRRGECDMAIAGGVNVILHPAHFSSLNALNMLSSHGRSMTFDERADGFAPGEGVGAVLLKSLEQAVTDGDTIWGVIKASFLNAGGKTGGYTVPNPNAQADLIGETLDRAGIDPQTISYVEAHGTGTALGDPIEIAALTRAYKKERKQEVGYCAVGSVKSNVGHLEGAAGIVGFTKVLLQMKHGKLAPSVHLENINPKIDFATSPFHPQRSLETWQGSPRRAGVSSFGAGGANVHVIVEEYATQTTNGFITGNGEPELYLLSARTEQQLREQVYNLADFISTQNETIDPMELAYTTQLGRREMSERIAIIAKDLNELESNLRSFLNGEENRNIYEGSIGKDKGVMSLLDDEDGKSYLRLLLEKRNLRKLAQAWIQGVRIDWRDMWTTATPKRLAFPTYPFERKSYWLTLDAEDLPAKPKMERAGKVTSRSQTKELDENAFYCTDHLVNGERWIPGVFFLSMVQQLNSETNGKKQSRIRDCQWLTPLNLNQHSAKIQVRFDQWENATEYEVATLDGKTAFTKGVLRTGQYEAPAAPDLTELRQQCTEKVDINAFYDSMIEAGLKHGSAFKVVESIMTGHEQCLGTISLPKGNVSSLEALPLHPSILDGALQTVASLDQSDTGYLPVGFTEMTQYRPLKERVLIHVKETVHNENSPRNRAFDLLLMDEQGVPLLFIQHLEIAPMFSKKRRELTANQSEKRANKQVRDDLKRMASQFLMVDESDVDLSGELLESGFDSVSLIELLEEVNQTYNLELQPQVLFDCPTLEILAQYLDPMVEIDTMPVENDADQPTMVNPIAANEPTITADKTAVKTDVSLPIESEQRGEQVASELRRMASYFLMVDEKEVDLEIELLESGFDSVSITELLEEVNQTYDLDFTPQILFDFPTLASFASFLAEKVPEAVVAVEQSDDSVETTVTENSVSSTETVESATVVKTATPKTTVAETTSRTSDSVESGKTPQSVEVDQNQNEETKIEPLGNRAENLSDSIAIVGIAGRMPGSDDPDSFWQHLVNGDNLVRTAPEDRKELLQDPETKAIQGGFIDGVGDFDASFFKISPREAESMDPQQRIFLETVWRSIEDAGYRPSDFAGTDTGLFVGVGTTDYNDLMTKNGIAIDGHTASGIAHSILANRVSYLLNLQGPSEVVDTACSSALVAIHRAVTALRGRECDRAIAGGVNLILAPGLFTAFNQSGMLSPDSKCKTFDQSANGYVRGEGVGAIILKPLTKAEEDGDHVYATVLGSAVGHGGRTNSLTAPSPKAQARVLVQAYKNAGIHPSTLSYVEAHGTGTKLGDPVETEGLKMAFEQLYEEAGTPMPTKPHIGLGSVKTNIGHLEAAAGIAGVLKVLLAMKHGELPASLHLETINPFLRLENSPFRITSKRQKWLGVQNEQGEFVCRAGVSSFGFGGTNAHVVLEAKKADRPVLCQQEKSLAFLISAPSKKSLSEYAQKLGDHLATVSDLDLQSLAFTLRAGREELKERAVIFADDQWELVDKLHRFAQGTADTTELLRGSSTNEANQAMLWIEGGELPQESFPNGQPPRLAGLPGFPFDRKRHWFRTPKAKSSEPLETAKTEVLQDTAPAKSSEPLIDTKTEAMAATDASLKPERVETPVEPLPAREPLSSVTSVETITTVKSVKSTKQPLSLQALTSKSSATETVNKKRVVLNAVTSKSLVTEEPPVAVAQVETANTISIEVVNQFLRKLLLDLLHITEEECSQELPFGDLGVDSIFSIQIIRQVNDQYGTDIKPAEIYDHNSVKKLSQFIVDTLPATTSVVETSILEEAPNPEKEILSEAQAVEESPSLEKEIVQEAQVVEETPNLEKQIVQEVSTKESDADGQNEVLEKKILGIVSEALDRPFSIDEKFMDSLTSFDMLRVISALEDEFGPLRKSLLFDYVTVPKLADFLKDSQPQTEDSASLTIELLALMEKALEEPLDPDRNFGEMMTSFDMLRAISVLEDRFGPLPKSLLFETENFDGLTSFLKDKKDSRPTKAERTPKMIGNGSGKIEIKEGESLVILKRDLPNYPELESLTDNLLLEYGKEGGLPGRDIAPYLFIGSNRKGFFNFSKQNNVMFSFSYVGTEEYLPELAAEYAEYGQKNGLKANFLSLVRLEEAQGLPFTATPFGVVQRLNDLPGFTLKGKVMRKLRYLVNKFSKQGDCSTEEYLVGSNPETDLQIANIIDQWAANKKMVNPYVERVRDEIKKGQLAEKHRMFLTWLNGELSNAIIITHIPSENGYLLDLEFYGEHAPLGGLEFSIAKIFELLIVEGITRFSFGGTFGVKVCDSENTEPIAERELQELRELGLVNNDGNVQFKNKFNPTNMPVYLCRPDEAEPTPVGDILLMIANPKATVREASTELTPTQAEQPLFDASTSASDEIDLLTDSWAEQELELIHNRMGKLRDRISKESFDLDSQTLLPFDCVIPASSGREAEAILCRALPRQGSRVLTNSLFPSWTFNLMDIRQTPVEVKKIEPEQESIFFGNMDLDDLKAKLDENPKVYSFVGVELSNNARGGYPVSMENLKQIRTITEQHDLLLVIDATRLIENALMIQKHESGYEQKSILEIARELLACGDAVTLSMSKDFGTAFGGIVATSNPTIASLMREQIALRGNSVNRENRSLLALLLNEWATAEEFSRQRMSAVETLWNQLNDANIPVIGPAGTHAVLIHVDRITRFADRKDPVNSCLSWIQQETGIRAAQHLASQSDKVLKSCIRLAIPVGLSMETVNQVAERLITAFQIEKKPSRKMLKNATNAAERPVEQNYHVIRETLPTVERHLIETNDGTIEVFTAGEPEKPVLLLMHPFNIGAGLFARQFKVLSQQYRVISIHHPGVGATNIKNKLSSDHVAKQFVTVLDQLGVENAVHIVGASAGGLQAQAFAHGYPNRTASLTLVCSSYKVGNRDGKVSPLAEVIQEDFERMTRGLEEPETAMRQLAPFADILLRSESMDPQTGLRYLDEFENLPDFLTMLPDLHVPSLIIQGRHDSVIDEETTKALHQGIPGAKLAVIEEAGHFPTVTHAEECNQLIQNFVRELKQAQVTDNTLETIDLQTTEIPELEGALL